jgi:hypothetical protein
MFNPGALFPTFHPSSKTWVFMSPTLFNSNTRQIIENKLNLFIPTWQSHGMPLEAAFAVEADRFVIVCVNHNAASAGGCSIDKLFHTMKQLEEATGLALLERNECAYVQNDGQITSIPTSDFKQYIQEGTIKPDTMVFNNTVADLNTLHTDPSIYTPPIRA